MVATIPIGMRKRYKLARPMCLSQCTGHCAGAATAPHTTTSAPHRCSLLTPYGVCPSALHHQKWKCKLWCQPQAGGPQEGSPGTCTCHTTPHHMSGHMPPAANAIMPAACSCAPGVNTPGPAAGSLTAGDSCPATPHPTSPRVQVSPGRCRLVTALLPHATAPHAVPCSKQQLITVMRLR
jgi:hypothetical protein